MRRDREGREARWHADPSAFARTLSAAGRSAGINNRVTPHPIRQPFATHLLEAGYDLRQVQTVLGQNKLGTTMLYTHVMNRRAIAVTSPLDLLARAVG